MTDYRPEIDGMRALAVLAVVLDHGGYGLPGGFIGVDIFFVISGFVICRQLVAQLQAGQFLWREFFIRRVRRILPLQILVTSVTLLLSWVLLLPIEFQRVCHAALAQCGFAVNFYFWRTVDYFGTAGKVQPLLHCWSLSVEEQFYLAFPACLLLSWRRLSRRALLWLLVLSGLASLACSQYLSWRSPWAGWYLHPSRTWELLLGCVLAMVPLRVVGWRAVLLDLAGAMLTVSGMFFFDHQSRFPGLAAVWPCLGAAFLICGNSDTRQFCGRLLALAPVVFTGRISYSIYLWHWPLLVLLSPFRVDQGWNRQIDAVFLPSLLLLSVVSWRFFEEPARRRWLQGRDRLFAAIVLTSLALVGVSAGAWGLSEAGNVLSGRAAVMAAARDSFRFVQEVDARAVAAGQVPRSGCMQDCKGSVAIWGDSHAMALLPAVESFAVGSGRSCWQLTHSQTAPAVSIWKPGLKFGLGERTGQFNEAVRSFLLRNHVDLVVISCVWCDYSSFETERFQQQLSATVGELVAAGIRVILVRDVARQDVDVPSALSLYVRLGWSMQKLGRPAAAHAQEVSGREQILAELAGQYRGSVAVVDPAEVMVDELGLWRMELDGECLYRDDNHLSEAGALRLLPLFERALLEVGVQ